MQGGPCREHWVERGIICQLRWLTLRASATAWRYCGSLGSPVDPLLYIEGSSAFFELLRESVDEQGLGNLAEREGFEPSMEL